ncbi:hypothetical protein [Absidia glauca]|uniref:Extracellular membrane protein CFEM domain-containing protein n=1 Tax=Absidia glauca TaxID=4829 RepID=A0A168N3C7_ABSGL|nr:hypothetical protein [Absidia glauca]
MKFLFATSVCVFVLSMAMATSAACDCEATDQTCIDKCVTEANSCVTSCKGETNCYEKCIDNDWPSGEMFNKQGMSSSMPAQSATPSASLDPAKATPSSSHSVASATSGMSAKPSQTSFNANNKNSSTSGASTVLTNSGVMMMGLVLGAWTAL